MELEGENVLHLGGLIGRREYIGFKPKVKPKVPVVKPKVPPVKPKAPPVKPKTPPKPCS